MGKSECKKSSTERRLSRVVLLDASIIRSGRHMSCDNGMEPKCKKSEANIAEPKQQEPCTNGIKLIVTGSAAGTRKPGHVRAWTKIGKPRWRESETNGIDPILLVENNNMVNPI